MSLKLKIHNCWFAFALILIFAGARAAAAGAASATMSYAVDSAVEPHGKPRPWLEAAVDPADARHLLGRTGFGNSLADLKTLGGMTRAEAVNFVVAGFSTEPYLPMPDWVNAPAPHFWARADLSADEQRLFDRTRDKELAQLRLWWASNILQTSSPQTERMVLFWHDHFATNYHAINRQSVNIARQNQTFRRLGMGSFGDLLKAMLRDPALLNFLDAPNNRKRAPNENLGRELLELFTLGEGNYNEATVREAARALTGRAFAPVHNFSYRLRSWHQDQENKTLFGVTGNHDGDDLVDLILAQPAAADFIATRFWLAFVDDRAPDQPAINAFAEVFRESDYDISVLYRAVLESEAFWAEEHRASLIKSPADLVFGIARTLEFPKAGWQQSTTLMAQSGMDLFAPPDVSGWKEGAAFVTSGRLLSRYRAVEQLLSVSASGKGVAHGSDTPAMSMQSADKADITDMAGANMDADTTMVGTAMSASSADMPVTGNDRSLLRVRLAAEDYHGPANYRVELIDGDTVIWNSEELTLSNGYDTELYGRVNNGGSLPWQTIDFEVSHDLLLSASQVAVYYVNDAAGPGGDRNLYVDGVMLIGSTGDQWIASSTGQQRSACPPESRVDSGNLYCAGAVYMDITESDTYENGSESEFVASRAHVHWASSGKDSRRLQILFALEDVSTPELQYDTFSAKFVVAPDSSMHLRVEAFECWPECFVHWPDCSWQDDNFPSSKTLNFPLTASEGSDVWCHYDGISSAEQQLIDTLWNSLPVLLDAVASTRRGERFAAELAIMRRHLDNYNAQLPMSRYAKSNSVLSLNDRLRKARQPQKMIKPPIAQFETADELMLNLNREGISLAELLLPGLDVSRVPDLSTLSELLPDAQLRTLIEHPAFQVR